MEKSTFIIDIDNTISLSQKKEDGSYDYDNSQPIESVIRRIQELHSDGHTIKLFTARGVRTFNGNVKNIKKEHEERLINWLKEFNVPYQDITWGKPWGENVFYIDDRSLSIHAFTHSNPDFFEQILKIENKY